jgi:hypothetical protein
VNGKTTTDQESQTLPILWVEGERISDRQFVGVSEMAGRVPSLRVLQEGYSKMCGG